MEITRPKSLGAELDSVRPTQSSKEPGVNFKGNFIGTTDPTASLNMLQKASVTFRALRDAMYLMCTMHNADVPELEALRKLEYGEAIRESADFTFLGPSNNV